MVIWGWAEGPVGLRVDEGRFPAPRGELEADQVNGFPDEVDISPLLFLLSQLL